MKSSAHMSMLGERANCVYVCMYVCVHACVCVYACMECPTPMHMYAWSACVLCACMYVCVRARTCLRDNRSALRKMTLIYVCMHIHTFTSIYIYIYIHTHKYIHTHIHTYIHKHMHVCTGPGSGERHQAREPGSGNYRKPHWSNAWSQRIWRSLSLGSQNAGLCASVCPSVCLCVQIQIDVKQ